MALTKEQMAKGGKNSRRGKDSNAELIRAQLSDLNVQQLLQEIAELPLKERVDAKLRVLNMILPRLQSVEAKIGLNSLKAWDTLDHQERLEMLQTLSQ